MTATLHHISTQQVAVKDREAYWREQICDVFVQLDCSHVSEGFYGEITDRTIGDLQLTSVKSSQHQVFRTNRQLSRTSEDYFLVSLQLAGVGVIEQDGRSAVLGPGDLALYDSTRRYSLRFDADFEELVLKLPRKAVDNRLAGSERLTATQIQGSSGISRVAFDFVRSVAAQADLLQSGNTHQLGENVLDVVVLAIGSIAEAKYCDVSATQGAQLLRINAFVRKHLRDAALSRELIAQANCISVRYLNKLYQAENMTVTQYIREERLRNIARDLINPQYRGRSISDIAYRWGMNSMPHFCRVFKAQFGCTPKAYRADARARFCA